ncbi:MAG TPA: asparagine synthase-related protein [Phycisphaerales bacterium]|nr:asparagine synthase-related protein [Phycisphaerales bacterium]
MCGIGGILRITPPGETYEPIPEEWLDVLDEGIAWRGPDGAGRFRDKVTKPDGTIVEVALVHRRLAIIDLEGGHQPMVSERGRVREDGTTEGLVAVVFNGCIYNHRELRAELQAKGHRFVTDHSDTEVLIHGWREHGNQWWMTEDDAKYSREYSRLSGVHEFFDGMYAALVWDRNRAALVSFRDRFEEKPLYETTSSDSMLKLYSSVPASLAQLRSLLPDHFHDAKPERAQKQWLTEVASWITLGYGPISTALPGVHRVHTWTMSLAHDLEKRRATVWEKILGFLYFAPVLVVAIPAILVLGYVIAIFFWPPYLCYLGARATARRLKSMRRGSSSAPTSRVDRLESAIGAAVASRLESDVPLGCFLSGGIDSSLLSLFAQRNLGNLTTLTVRMPNPRLDESAYAARVAAHLGSRHVVVECSANHAADDLIQLVHMLGLPFGDSSLLPTYWLCSAARQHVKVALSGDGGDELFYGYDRYRAARWLDLRRFLLKPIPVSWLNRNDPKSNQDRLVRLIEASRHQGYVDLVSIFPYRDRRRLLRHSPGFEVRRGAFGGVREAQGFDIGSYLPGDLLRKTDTASLAAGLEVRCPFLEPEVVYAAWRYSPRVHMRGETKHLLKELARKYLPREVVDRPKQGFAIPLSEWWRTDFGGLRTLMLDHLTGSDPFPGLEALQINMDYVRQMIDEHMSAGDGPSPIGQLTPARRRIRARDHAQRLYMLTVLSIWAKWLKGVEEGVK